jgi:hypothetical protein
MTERKLTIEQWHNIALTGAAPAMCIPLQGDSMMPLIRRNLDLVSIVPLTRPLKRGDVVLFEYPKGRYVVHRVYRLKDEQVQTLGDHCRCPEPWLPLTSVWGLAASFQRDGKTISLDCPQARAYGRWRMATLPIRKVYWNARSLAGRTLRKLGWRR